MSLTDDLYREIILEHFKNPRHPGRLEKPDIAAQGANPFCGDELEITISLENDKIKDIRFAGKGCSISQASASMMTEAVEGKDLHAAEQIAAKFRSVMLNNAPWDLPSDLSDLESLEGVKKYPVRIKCAILGWNTLLDGIQAHRHGKKEVSHVEGEEGQKNQLSQTAAEAIVSDMASQKTDESSSPEEQVRTALKGVIDPELNMNIVDLGLIYGVDVKNNVVKVTYSLTSPGCPLGPVIKGQIHSVLGRIPWIKEIHPELVWSPPWDPRTMASEEAKTELGIW